MSPQVRRHCYGMSRGFLCFGVKNVLKFKLNAFFTYTEYSYNIKKRKSNGFLKGRANRSQLLAIFPRNKGKT